MRIERQIHHYGSGLNAIPLITQFRTDPTDMYLLRVGFAGLSGPLSNIDEGGFAAASFHSFEDTLKWDGYSGDYGPNFVGHAIEMGTYIVEHPDFGWQAFGGNVVSTTPTVQIQCRDSIRRRVFLASLGALLTLDAGAFSSVEYNPVARSVTLFIDAAAGGSTNAADAPLGRLIITQTAAIDPVGVLKPSHNLSQTNGAWNVPFTKGSATVILNIN